MKRRMTFRWTSIGIVTVYLIIVLLASLPVPVFAGSNTINVLGKQYELDEKSKYAYTDGVIPTTITASGSQFGQFSITGDLKPISNVDSFIAYEASNGIVTLSYEPNGKVIGATETDWHLIEDKGKDINGEALDNKIRSGAVMLQTSIDGQSWITDIIKTNIAGDDTDYESAFYETPEIQLINGCYYRVVVAYEVERTIEKKHWYDKGSEQKKYVEVYEFYLKDISDTLFAAGAHPNTKKVVGDKTNVTNTGKDNGFSGNNAITTKDPHYGWEIGVFSLKGFTNIADYQGEEYFLKNSGDVITLAFTLYQDINKLNGDSSLSIAEDKNGSDQFFDVLPTNFKHGTLIIRFTDFEGKKSKPIVYTDFLAASAKTGADTRVQFFEEGDYEVALDYEIMDSQGIDSYTNYRMAFGFKIRNGNNMVYAFDNSGQLADKAWTATGFTINTANSHYLTVTVNKYVVVDSVGGKKLDLAWSKTASDGNTYNEVGVYVVSVSNRYQPSGDDISKTFYVGNDPYIRAIPITGKSLEEIVELIKYTDYDMQTYLDTISNENKSLDVIVDLVKQGWTIDAGKLIEPVLPTPEPEAEAVPNEEENSIEVSEEADKQDSIEVISSAIVTAESTSTRKPEFSEQDEEIETKSGEHENSFDIKNLDKNSVLYILVIILALIAISGWIFYAASRNKHKRADNNSDKVNNRRER